MLKRASYSWTEAHGLKLCGNVMWKCAQVQGMGHGRPGVAWFSPIFQGHHARESRGLVFGSLFIPHMSNPSTEYLKRE